LSRFACRRRDGDPVRPAPPAFGHAAAAVNAQEHLNPHHK